MILGCKNLYRMFFVLITRFLSFVARSLKCHRHFAGVETLETCTAEQKTCSWTEAVGVTGYPVGCNIFTIFPTTKLPITANQCIKKLKAGAVVQTQCYCNTDGCNKKCTASECKAAAAARFGEGIGDGLQNLGDGIGEGMNDLVDGANSSIQNATNAGDETYETCVAKCDGTKMVSSIIFVASQALLGFLILNMKMTE